MVMGPARHDVVGIAACAVEAPSSGAMSGAEALSPRGELEVCREKIMEMLDTYDLTGSLRDAVSWPAARTTR